MRSTWHAIAGVALAAALGGCGPNVPKYGPHGINLYDDVKIKNAQLILGAASAQANSLHPLFVHVAPDVSVSGISIGRHYKFKSSLSTDGAITVDADDAEVVRCVDVKHPWFVRSLTELRTGWGEPAWDQTFDDGTYLAEYKFDHPDKKKNAEDLVSVIVKTAGEGDDLIESITWLR